jgi:hypothetical protein
VAVAFRGNWVRLRISRPGSFQQKLAGRPQVPGGDSPHFSVNEAFDLRSGSGITRAVPTTVVKKRKVRFASNATELDSE